MCNNIEYKKPSCRWDSRPYYLSVTFKFKFKFKSKVHDFNFIWKGVYHFLLVINSNVGHIFYRLATMSRSKIQGHLRSLISISSVMAYGTSY